MFYNCQNLPVSQTFTFPMIGKWCCFLILEVHGQFDSWKFPLLKQFLPNFLMKQEGIGNILT